MAQSSRMTMLLGLVITLALLAANPAAAAAAKKSSQKDEPPPALNPYANRPYAGCAGGYCPSSDPEAEAALFRAAAAGDTARALELLDGKSGARGGGAGAANGSRNIAPDGQGFVRVIDAALYAAVKHGRRDTVAALLDRGYKADYEEGHVVDLAAANGDLEMLDLLLERGFHIGSDALVHAAKHGRADMIRKLLAAARAKVKGRPPDLKSAMRAACAAGNETSLRVLVEEGGFDEILHPVSKRPTVHDWRGDYVAEAVRTGHPVVLEILFGRGYELTWQNAQELVTLAASVGNVESLERLFAQRTIAGDADELEESVENALKAAAAEGHEAAVEWLLAKHPKLSKPACPPALLKATAYGHAAVVRQLQRACNVSAGSERLQAAGWLGALFNAARGGHGKVVRLLLADEDAAEMLSKVHAGIKRKKDGPPVAPHPEKDPLAIAAARGHLEVVELLMPFRALCAPCAAAAAAAAGHADAFVMLASGPAAAMLEDDEDKVQDALRSVANAMEGGHWDVVRTILTGHDSPNVGPYFFPAIAQRGRSEDLTRMLALVDEIGAGGSPYVGMQLTSAALTAALNGDVEMLLLLEREREARRRADDNGGEDGEDGGGGGGDKSEL